jgi:putative membrane protein
MKHSSVTLIGVSAVLLAASSSAMAQSGADKHFIKKAITGDNSEIMLGKIAQDRGDSQGVKDFGAMLVTDHSQGRDKAAQIAAGLGVSPPDGPSAGARLEQAKLMVLTGHSFDHEFAHYMLKDHKKDIADFKKEARGHGPTAELAQNTLPLLEKHLDTARDLEAKTR